MAHRHSLLLKLDVPIIASCVLLLVRAIPSSMSSGLTTAGAGAPVQGSRGIERRCHPIPEWAATLLHLSITADLDIKLCANKFNAPSTFTKEQAG